MSDTLSALLRDSLILGLTWLVAGAISWRLSDWWLVVRDA
jgi:hypothetical protein